VVGVYLVNPVGAVVVNLHDVNGMDLEEENWNAERVEIEFAMKSIAAHFQLINRAGRCRGRCRGRGRKGKLF